MDVQTGCCVQVEFAHRQCIGYVVEVSEVRESSLGDLSLNDIGAVLTSPYFDETSARLAAWIAREYVSTLSDAIRLFMPPGASPKMRRLPDGTWEYQAPATRQVDDRWARLTEEGFSFEPRKNATKQHAVIAALREGEMRVAELGIEIDGVSSVLKALEKAGVVHIESRRRMRGERSAVVRDKARVDLTAGQRDALSAIHDAMDRSCGEVIVIDGVTGSGKTEVYLQAISETLAAGKSACVLVPEISLTPQTVGRFRARFGDMVAVLHSRLSAGERFDQWDLIRSGDARVVVGARSALFAPIRNLGLLVIDEEHESSYKQGSSPRYSSRAVAEKLVELRGATLVLGSASPAVETLYQCHIGNWKRVELPVRASGKPLPPVEIVDLSSEFSGGNKTMFSNKLSTALKQTVERGEKAVLLLNRRGFASFLLCRECGYVPTCERCSTSMTYHVNRNRRGDSGALMCHHCGSKQEVPPRCPECGSPYLRQLGPGTQFAYDQLVALLGPDVPIIRMDADTTRTKGAHERLLGEFSAADRGVLIGTQMIAKGLDFPDVTLAGVIIADTTLKLPDFRASERTFQLIEQVAGRAGRADKPGRVIVQTYWPSHPAIVAASKHDRSMFLAKEIPARETLCYPPFKRMANVLVWGKDEYIVSQHAKELGRTFESALEAEFGKLTEERGTFSRRGWELLGPSPCLLSKLNGIYRWHLLIKAPNDAPIPEFISRLIRNRKGSADVSIAVDVDPVDLF